MNLGLWKRKISSLKSRVFRKTSVILAFVNHSTCRNACKPERGKDAVVIREEENIRPAPAVPYQYIKYASAEGY